MSEESTYDALLADGAAAYQHLDLAGAETAYRRAVELEPEGYEAHLGLARTLIRQRRRKEALAEAERLVALAPERFEGHATLGTLYFLTDEYDEALAALRQALEQAPEEPEPRLTLAQIHADRGEFERARAALAEARAQIASLGDEGERLQMEAFALHAETYILLAEGRNGEAAEAAQRVVAMSDANPHAASLAYSNLGILAARDRNLEAAADYLDRAYAMNPYFHRAGGLLGRILYVRGHYQRAAEVLGRVVQSLPEPEPTTRYAYGLALAKSGRRAEAREAFRAALREGLRGVNRVMAWWQVIWQSTVGRYAVVAGLLIALAAWLLLARPDPQSLTLAALFLVFFVAQRLLRRRQR